MLQPSLINPATRIIDSFLLILAAGFVIDG